MKHSMMYEVLIIGGGQAGLAMGFSLKQKNIPFVILDENEQTGMPWQKRYDSLRLFTPRSYSQLHEFHLKGDPKGFPDKNEIADYLAAFKIQNELPVHHEKVIKLTQNEKEQFLVTTLNKTYKAKQVVVATGAFYNPFVPKIHDGTANFEIHASKYQNPSHIPNGNVLIVGAGNTGVQIAAELSKTHQVTLSQSKPMKRVPQNIAGRSLFWWLETFRIGRAKPDSFIGISWQSKRSSALIYGVSDDANYIAEKIQE